MRFVPVNCLREGSIVAKKLVGRNGELLLNAGTVIQNSYIEKIKRHGYNGIYIEDDFSKDIEISGLISDELKYRTVFGLKKVYKTLEQEKKLSNDDIEKIYNLANNLLEELLSNKELIVNMIDIKMFDEYTYFHSVNVSVLSIVIGISLNLDKNLLYNLALSSLLHDIGKVFIDKEILNKRGKLTKKESEIIRTHPFSGYDYLKSTNHFPASVYIGILQHHEKCNGAGYPMALSGKNISLFGKIISIADIYDAMTSDRPYRKALLPSEAIEYIMGGSGTLFDKEIVKYFVERITPYPNGTCVRLSNNSLALVVENYKDCCLRPKVKVIFENDKLVDPYILDLRNDQRTRNITIVGLFNL
ncbi:MAG TPA: HD-GYP domain-containing protein [Clostridiaceae bacterium]|nr:HD-GYP domain-containing protein [Clostridiaceae bacterium]